MTSKKLGECTRKTCWCRLNTFDDGEVYSKKNKTRKNDVRKMFNGSPLSRTTLSKWCEILRESTGVQCGRLRVGNREEIRNDLDYFKSLLNSEVWTAKCTINCFQFRTSSRMKNEIMGAECWKMWSLRSANNSPGHHSFAFTQRRS